MRSPAALLVLLLPILAPAQKAVSCCGLGPTSVLVCRDGGHVDHGPYYSAGNQPGTAAWYEAVLAISDTNGGYWWSDGYGGAHAMLAGFSGLFASGNVWSGSTATSWGSFDPVAVGEWHHYAVGWDGAYVTHFTDGVPDGIVAFSGPRTTQSLPAGGNAFVCGSDHSTLNCRLAWIRAWEATNFLAHPNPAAARSAFRPQWSPTSYATVSFAAPSFLADYTTPSVAIVDLSPGFNGRRHPGSLWNPLNPLNQARGTSGVQITPGAVGPAGYQPIPYWVYDSTAPRRGSAPSPPVFVGVISPAPPGAKIFDSFSRADSDYAFTYAPSLGSTESGSLGPVVWHTRLFGSSNIFGKTTWSDWGVFRGRAVNLDTLSNPSIGGHVAWVQSDSPDMDVRVDRQGASSYDLWQQTGLVFRVSTDGSTFKYLFFRAQTTRSVGCGHWNGSSFSACDGAPPDMAPFPLDFTTLRVVASGTTVRVYTDGNLIGVLEGQVTFQSQTGAGLFKYSNPGNGLHRWDNFTLY